ncbi:unnamed protein product [Adineta steineri]|uniref:Syndecan n=1 Tax=Adineta steineri TaxID=433720 RepID=A0A814ME32_9BILA|nr:unnamed protein product [Adineta steineri]CAF1075300.1 unnamed protein product [Adineta steineri]CAF3708781.1 unnamed protein product [Adineta steineri]CAF3961400.1 unnamed protein product [Adineta steineri]
MTTSSTYSSTTQIPKIIMINKQYNYSNLYYSWSILTVFILLIYNPILVIAQQIQPVSTLTSKAQTITTSITTILSDEGNIYYTDNENSDGEGDIYDDQVDSNDNSPSTIISQTKSQNNITSQFNGEAQEKEYDDPDSYTDEEDPLENEIYGNTMSVNRAELDHTVSEPVNKKPTTIETTSRLPFMSSDLWRDLFTRPAILVGVVGGIVIGMLSAILLIMFIIYRMRKKDEGSYALEERPSKSPSHAYTRVSSREFFA